MGMKPDRTTQGKPKVTYPNSPPSSNNPNWHRVVIPAEIEVLCREFAIKVAPTTDYSDTGQGTFSKVQFDHYIGKLAEFAVKLWFDNIPDCTCTNPDIGIQYGSQKSFSPDLHIKLPGAAAANPTSIKGQSHTQARIFSWSWTFQRDLNGRFDPSQDKKDHQVIFAQVFASYQPVVYISNILLLSDMTFAEPALEYLKDKKEVVYQSKNKALE